MRALGSSLQRLNNSLVECLVPKRVFNVRKHDVFKVALINNRQSASDKPLDFVYFIGIVVSVPPIQEHLKQLGPGDRPIRERRRASCRQVLLQGGERSSRYPLLLIRNRQRLVHLYNLFERDQISWLNEDPKHASHGRRRFFVSAAMFSYRRGDEMNYWATSGSGCLPMKAVSIQSGCLFVESF